MKKQTYIAPEVLTVEMPKQPLMTAVSGFEGTINTETQMNPNTSLSKGGGWLWSDDEPEDYEE